LDRRDKALRFVDLAGRGLEIGPSYNPLVPKASGARIETVDHADRETLVAKYTAWGLPADKIKNIEVVDHLWAGGSLLETVPDHHGYDYIVASHVIEHTVDLIRFLNDCEGLLKESGKLALVVPDKRYCFDRFQPLSTVGDAVDAFHATNAFHTAGALLDHQAYASRRGEAIAWSRHDVSSCFAQFPNLEGAEDVIRTGLSQDGYADIHKWKFTPTSFALLVRDLEALGFHDLGVLGSDGTEGFEFFVTLAKGVRSPPVNRIDILLQIEAELAHPADPLTSDELTRRIEAFSRELAAMQRSADELSQELATVRTSRSWRMAGPLRDAANALWRRRLRR
jgi:hypothetical protein